MDKILKHKTLLIIIGAVILVIVFIASGVANRRKAEEEQAERDRLYEEQMAQANAGTEGEVTDNLLLQMQPDLIASYGKLPDGYIWDVDGSLLSLGDPDMSAEEVVYAYLNGLRTLDLSMAQKYSRDSVVLDTYESYFDENNKNQDYTDQFIRNMYREALLSFNVKGITNSTVFAENMQVFTVDVEMLDLTDKDFWKKDKIELYRNLDIYDSDQSDSTRADIYLYDYILDYYQSEDAATRDVSFDLTLQRYPDLDTGWLVSVDTDVDSACRYADGRLVVSYINEMYIDEGRELLESLDNQLELDGTGAESAETGSSDTSEAADEGYADLEEPESTVE